MRKLQGVVVLAAWLVACGSNESPTSEGPGPEPSASSSSGGEATGSGGGSTSSGGGSTSSGGGGSSSGASGSSSGGSSGASSGGPPGVPAKITMISGTGATLLENWPGGTFKLRVTDAGGAGVSGVVVTWSLVSGDGAFVSSPGSPTDTTDADGLVARMVNGTGFNPSMPYGQAVIRATTSVGSLDFKTITVHGSSIGPVPALIYVSTPDSHELGEVKAGTVLPNAIGMDAAVQTGFFSGTMLPGVALRVVDNTDHDKPGAARCAGSIAFTNASGHATCDLEVGSALGDQWIAIYGGEQSIFGAYHLTIVP
jgi:hypothetical protein